MSGRELDVKQPLDKGVRAIGHVSLAEQATHARCGREAMGTAEQSSTGPPLSGGHVPGVRVLYSSLAYDMRHGRPRHGIPVKSALCSLPNLPRRGHTLCRECTPLAAVWWVGVQGAQWQSLHKVHYTPALWTAQDGEAMREECGSRVLSRPAQVPTVQLLT